MMEQDRALKGSDVVRFLEHLLRRIAGKLLVVWDGSPIHRAKAVKEFLEGGAASRLKLQRLPGYYAPELNPDEGIWKHLKHVELKNVCCRNLSELRGSCAKPRSGSGTRLTSSVAVSDSRDSMFRCSCRDQ